MKRSVIVIVMFLAACREPATPPQAATPRIRASNTTGIAAPTSAGSATVDASPTVLTIGGDVKAPVVMRRVEPTWTSEMKCRSFVIIQAVIDERGIPVEVKDSPSGPDAFTASYAAAVTEWRFREV